MIIIVMVIVTTIIVIIIIIEPQHTYSRDRRRLLVMCAGSEPTGKMLYVRFKY